MTTESTDTKKWWLFTMLSLLGTLALLFTITPWFWVGLPFLFTAFVKAMDWM